MFVFSPTLNPQDPFLQSCFGALCQRRDMEVYNLSNAISILNHMSPCQYVGMKITAAVLSFITESYGPPGLIPSLGFVTI